MKIFVSYRQNDSPGDVRQLCERLAQSFGCDNVFFDIHSIKLGDNWWAVAREKILSSDVLLVPIGNNWLTVKDKNGRRKLDDPRDPVRKELALAFKEKIRTIPVLVEGAGMPDAESLPSELRELADLSACELRHRSFARDVDALVESLGGGASVPTRSQAPGADFLSILGKSFAAKLGERLATAAAVPRAAPAQDAAPAASVPAPAPLAAVGIAGTWQSPTGNTHVIWQQGTAVRIESRNPFGIVMVQGQGTLTGSQLRFFYTATYQPPVAVRGQARCIVSPDRMTITGECADPVIGVQPVYMRRVG